MTTDINKPFVVLRKSDNMYLYVYFYADPFKGIETRFHFGVGYATVFTVNSAQYDFIQTWLEDNNNQIITRNV